MATPTKWGNEILANTTTVADQYQPITAGLTNGRFVVVWLDDSATGIDKFGTALRGQIFNADGSKAGAEIAINTDPSDFADNQINPVITPLADGGFIVAWDDFSGFGGNPLGNSVAQIFHADGTTSGGAFLLNTNLSAPQVGASLTQLADGHIVATWTDFSQRPDDPSSLAVRGQIFNTDGTKSGSEFLVNTTTAGLQSGSSVTALNGGGFVATWGDDSHTGGDMTGSAVRAQIFNANGTKSGAEFLVNTTTASDQDSVRIAALSGGGFVVTFTDFSNSADDSSVRAVRAQVFDASGAKVGTEFLVNTTTAGAQYSEDIAVLHDGRFVIAWADLSQTPGDTSSSAVRAQVFNPDGTKSGAEFLVNTTTLSDQGTPHITVLADGRFVVGWVDFSHIGGDADSGAVHAQIFDPREIGVTVIGTAQNDDYVGSQFHDVLIGNGGNDHLDGGAGDDTAGFSGAKAQYQISHLANGDLQVSDLRAGSPDGTDTLHSVEHLAFSDTTVNLNQLAAHDDFNGNGHSDILFQNADGTPMVWSMDGLNATSMAVAGFNPGAAWHVIGSGDFDGGGKSDLLWQNQDGTPAAWLMNGSNILSGANVGFNPGADWHEIAAADFNGDGKADILWQNTDGQAAVWQMDGLNLTAGSNVGFNPGAAWHVIGAGDFDGDGKADILWQNSNGQAAVWLMDGTNVKSGSDVGTNAGSAWHVQATGDFNGDGKADILWQNADGTPAIWLMDGTSLISGANVGFNPGAAWQVHGTGDFNGDGKADIEWQNSDGTPAVWLMDGTNVVSGANAGADPGANWHVIPQHHDLV
jgi:FG-GAP-like repeat/RTX calcium-binding nonapeptide repeat (4 copies)